LYSNGLFILAFPKRLLKAKPQDSDPLRERGFLRVIKKEEIILRNLMRKLKSNQIKLMNWNEFDENRDMKISNDEYPLLIPKLSDVSLRSAPDRW
jgi:hypothetical protein